VQRHVDGEDVVLQEVFLEALVERGVLEPAPSISSPAGTRTWRSHEIVATSAALFQCSMIFGDLPPVAA
jgi:hypothetical protein